VKSAFADARSAVCRRVQRVFVIASRPSQADAVVKLADAIGARVAVDEGKYCGKGSDATKRAHFKDTTRAWFWADAVIATSTLSVGVNVPRTTHGRPMWVLSRCAAPHPIPATEPPHGPRLRSRRL
jgi:hypothetical protein